MSDVMCDGNGECFQLDKDVVRLKAEGKSLRARMKRVSYQATVLDVWCAQEDMAGRDARFVRDVVKELRELSTLAVAR